MFNMYILSSCMLSFQILLLISIDQSSTLELQGLWCMKYDNLHTKNFWCMNMISLSHNFKWLKPTDKNWMIYMSQIIWKSPEPKLDLFSEPIKICSGNVSREEDQIIYGSSSPSQFQTMPGERNFCSAMMKLGHLICLQQNKMPEQ